MSFSGESIFTLTFQNHVSGYLYENEGVIRNGQFLAVELKDTQRSVWRLCARVISKPGLYYPL